MDARTGSHAPFNRGRMRERWTRTIAAMLLLSAGAGVGLLGSKARAEGIPVMGALTYSGYLESPTGEPEVGTRAIAVRLWASADADSELCEQEQSEVELLAGRFQVLLPDECTEAVKANPNVFVDVLVDGVSLGRTPLGAVPYAVEAAHAVEATHATSATEAASASAATGALKATLDGLAPKATPSGFRASRDANLTLPHNTQTPVSFTTEHFDLNAEFDTASSTFSPKAAGYYSLQCSIFFYVPGVSAVWQVQLMKNGVTAAVDAGNTDGNSAARIATAILELAPGDEVKCHAFQNSGAARDLWGSGGLNGFEGFRVAGSN
jgi:hypothetical protein